jgi:hypothetical protein
MNPYSLVLNYDEPVFVFVFAVYKELTAEDDAVAIAPRDVVALEAIALAFLDRLSSKDARDPEKVLQELLDPLSSSVPVMRTGLAYRIF